MSKDILTQILEIVGERNSTTSDDLSSLLNITHNAVIGHLNSIKARGELIETEPVQQMSWELTDDGKYILEHGSHEYVVYQAVRSKGGAPLADIMKEVPNAKIGYSKAMANGWLHLEKPSNVLTPKVDSVDDEVRKDIELINSKDFSSVTDPKKQDYKKRKLIKQVSVVKYNVKKGKEFTLNLAKEETELTPEMIADGSWKTKPFKNYNFEALGVPPDRGYLHPLLKVRKEFRDIFLEMGFSEMPTNNFVESSFWNFDALYQPQQHPARDAHDTFFLSHPKECSDLPKDYLERVKKVHSEGGHGSIGYKYNWSLDEAKKNLLRTHTTAVSARMLYKLAQNKPFKPVKFFSIDRVFRNETLDATHLAEFHQIEGVIADFDVTLGDLIGVLYEFFKKLGIDKLKFKPAYNPYTEPSMEIFCFHPGLGKWIEVGNSGVFRPEMVLPMGLPENVNVIAWGLSLERPTMIKYKLNNIRDLIGPRVQLQNVYDNPICRLDKM